jgi:hypothetical protein
VTSISTTSRLCEELEAALNKLIADIGPIRIGSTKQFPFGWRKAAKGRTVWRILEELISQNLEARHREYGFSNMVASESEVSVYDFRIQLSGETKPTYVNIKSCVKGARTNKDDISKAVGLKAFYSTDSQRELFIATFVIDFKDNMTIEIEKCHVMPIAWLPDIYVNPSNNGNLQSARYKNVGDAVKRTNEEFLLELDKEMQIALHKRRSR